MAYDVFFGENKMTASDFMLCTTYVGCLYSPLYYFEWIWIEWKEDCDNIDQMIKFLSEEIEVRMKLYSLHPIPSKFLFRLMQKMP